MESTNSATAASSAPMSVSSAPAQSQQKQQSQQQPQTQHTVVQHSANPMQTVQVDNKQVRTRVTVVCGECKRLKLKCDRRTPCGSCTKRDTVSRCIYSPAASEKIDVQSIHNRVLTLESQMSQVLSTQNGPSSSSQSLSSSHHASQPSSYNDRSLLAIGQSGSSVLINLEDVAGIWMQDLLKDLELGVDGLSLAGPASQRQQRQNPYPNQGSAQPHHPQVKLEPMAPLSLSQPTAASLESSAASVLRLLPSFASFYSQSSSSPTVTPSLLSYLPTDRPTRELFLGKCDQILTLHPCIDWPHFKTRVQAFFDNAKKREKEEAKRKLEHAREVLYGVSSPASGSAQSQRTDALPELSLSFFASVCAIFALGALICKEEDYDDFDVQMLDDDGEQDGFVGGANSMSVDEPPDRSGKRRKTPQHGATSSSPSMPSIPLRSPHTPSPAFSSPMDRSASLPGSGGPSSFDPSFLLALSGQCLEVFEHSFAYDMDYLEAMILQALCLVHNPNPSVGGKLFTMVGKMVNIARLMGLASDPDEFPNRYSASETETRRRTWWCVYYLDLFMSDCIGQPPLIAENSHTTRLPWSESDDMWVNEIVDPADGPHGVAYFTVKCRLAQLVKSAKKQTLRSDPSSADSPGGELDIEQAARFEDEIHEWLMQLPPVFQLDLGALNANNVSSLPTEGSSSVPTILQSDSLYLTAQRCELLIIASRLILKLYTPFLRNRTSLTVPPHAKTPSWHQAYQGTVNAAHVIISASRLLHTVWKHTRRQAAFLFYSFGRTLFDATICLAHAIINQPTAIWTSIAMEDFKHAKLIMQDPAVANRRSVEGTNGDVGGAAKILDIMFEKAEAALRGDSSHTGSKRKHEEVSLDSSLSAVSHLPYVGPGVVMTDSASVNANTDMERIPASPSVPPPTSSSHVPTAGGASAPSPLSPDRCDPTPEGKKSTKGGKTRHPSVGIRVRNKESLKTHENRGTKPSMGNMNPPSLPRRTSYSSAPGDAFNQQVSSPVQEEPVFANQLDYKVMSLPYTMPEGKDGPVNGDGYTIQNEGARDLSVARPEHSTGLVYSGYPAQVASSPVYGAGNASDQSNASSPYPGLQTLSLGDPSAQPGPHSGPPQFGHATYSGAPDYEMSSQPYPPQQPSYTHFAQEPTFTSAHHYPPPEAIQEHAHEQNMFHTRQLQPKSVIDVRPVPVDSSRGFIPGEPNRMAGPVNHYAPEGEHKFAASPSTPSYVAQGQAYHPYHHHHQEQAMPTHVTGWAAEAPPPTNPMWAHGY